MTALLTDIKKNNGDCAFYTGTVTVSSYLGDRLIKKETHHNEGLLTLFRFIGNCLQGSWYEAKFTKPCKLVLLKQADDETFDKEDANYSTPLKKPNYWSSEYAVCSPIMYDNAPVAETNIPADKSNVSSSVTYHFRVPFLSLISGSEIKKLMLLPLNPTNYAENACAYFILDEAINVPEAGGNFTVIID